MAVKKGWGCRRDGDIVFEPLSAVGQVSPCSGVQCRVAYSIRCDATAPL